MKISFFAASKFYQMQICKTKLELKQILEPFIREGKLIGFVPTMGALHLGHLSLIEESVKINDITISSVFVNPTQFNNSDDLDKYPSDLEKDVAMLALKGCDYVFAPNADEMYPEKDERQFYFDGIETRMEGEHRPWHFNGVAQIVSKLFAAVPATNAYFGLKDFQQLAIIKHLVKQLSLDINIVSCPTIREKDGLAMSSRNLLLKKEFRKQAPLIYSVLKEVKSKSNHESVEKIKEFVETTFGNHELLKLEYFDIVDDTMLKPIDTFSKEQTSIGCIAVWAGEVRLIDNIQINL